jgi:hypothetical protein
MKTLSGEKSLFMWSASFCLNPLSTSVNLCITGAEGRDCVGRNNNELRLRHCNLKLTHFTVYVQPNPDSNRVLWVAWALDCYKVNIFSY